MSDAIVSSVITTDFEKYTNINDVNELKYGGGGDGVMG